METSSTDPLEAVWKPVESRSGVTHIAFYRYNVGFLACSLFLELLITAFIMHVVHF